MTKRSILKLMALVTFSIAVACSGDKKEAAEKHEHAGEHEAKSEDWKEMDEFHMVMAESFHPYKDSSNLEPAKAKAVEMAAAADKWASAPLPEKVNNDEVKAKLGQLKTETAAFAETVKSADDQKIGESLTSLHDLFHELQETWYGGHHDHHHE